MKSLELTIFVGVVLFIIVLLIINFLSAARSLFFRLAPFYVEHKIEQIQKELDTLVDNSAPNPKTPTKPPS
jgi:hypothetical protein